MFRVNPITSAAGAKQYYTQALRREDYYIQGQEIVGHWHGKGAALLRLAGAVDRERFFALVDNQHPDTGNTLTVRQNDKRRVGYDFTFSAPKSVSILHAMTGDERMVEALRASVLDTMREMEGAMQTQVSRGGKQLPRTTGNMVWADFIHTVGRPVDGVPDPDLHMHCVVFNATYDRKERRWKAGEFHDLKRDAPYYEAVFHAHLAARLRALGFGIERHGKWWDVAGIPRDLIDKFSNRTKEIEAKALALGITDPEAKGALGAKIRQAKRHDLDRATLQAEWEGRLSGADRKVLETVLSGGSSADSGGKAITPEAALEHAIAHSFERASVVSDKQLLEAALRRGVGQVAPGAVHNALVRSRVLSRTVDGRTLVTTRAVLDEERAMLAFARNGRGSCRSLGGLAAESYHSDRLNAGQNAAVKHVLTTPDRVMIIRGWAGTGKTTLMKEAIRQIEARSGKRVLTFAPSASASRGVLREEAGLSNADTVARLLQDEVMQERLRGQVLWIDEAGLLSVPDMAKVFHLANRLDCRVILSGDSGQHAGVQRGDSLRLLETRAGLRPVEVTEIRRQRGTYREAVKALAGRNLEKGMALLDTLGWIVQEPGDRRHALLVKDYLAALNERKSVLVVSPTHREADEVTRLMREALKATGRIGRHDRTYWTLRNLYWTDAQKADAASYRPGLVVQVFQNGKGLVRGERLQVEGTNQQGQVIAVKREGEDVTKRVVLPLDQAARYQVYEIQRLGVAAGDTIRITQNGRTEDGHAVNNGALYQVKTIAEDGTIVLANDWRLGQDFGHLTHGYVTTSHASQGRTVQRVFLAQGEESFPASFLEQFYVSVSRGTESCRIYTSDTQELLQRVRESGQRTSATELIEGTVTRKPVNIRELRRLTVERYRRYMAQLERVLGRGAALELVRNQEPAREGTRERIREHGGPVMER